MATDATLPILVKKDDIVEGWIGKPKAGGFVGKGLLDPQVTYVSK